MILDEDEGIDGLEDIIRQVRRRNHSTSNRT